MPVEMKSESDASVTSLVSGILNDAQDLFKQQVDLLKHELREDIRKTKDASLVLGLAVGLLLLGAVLLSFMLAYLLSWAMPELPLWACFGIVGGAVDDVGAKIARFRRRQFTRQRQGRLLDARLVRAEDGGEIGGCGGGSAFLGSGHGAREITNHKIQITR